LRREYQAVFVGIGAQKGVKLKALKLELGNGCKKCADACPCGYIEMN
jgi:Fe-S-cluster-containing hydrogenase component 2